MAKCYVSYLDTSGLRHTVEVEAESLYEAAALGIAAFRHHQCEPGSLAQLNIEVRSSITHTLTVQRLKDWVSGASKSPKEAVVKERLKEIL